MLFLGLWGPNEKHCLCLWEHKLWVHMRPERHMKLPPVMTAHIARQGQRVPQESCAEWKVPEWVY